MQKTGKSKNKEKKQRRASTESKLAAGWSRSYIHCIEADSQIDLYKRGVMRSMWTKGEFESNIEIEK